MPRAELQVALDFINLDQALRAARGAAKAGADRLEAGTPLIKSEGLDAVRRLREECPSADIVADMKVMDAGRVETESAAKAGADFIHVLGAASDSTVQECIEAAERYGASITVDLLGVGDAQQMAARAREVQELGADEVCIHTPIDLQMQGKLPLEDLRVVAAEVDIPVAVAGGINSETAPKAVEAGAAVVIVGGAITKAPDPAEATATILEAIETGTPAETELFTRQTGDAIAEVLRRASAADVTEALHRTGALQGVRPIVQGAKMVGRALTVWTYPGDWAKPVEAIDRAGEGDVLVIDAGGHPPAVWGEMATLSCLQRKLAGVVIHGAIRDTMNIREMEFPAFASLTTPQAGEPKGRGMIDVELKFGGQTVRTGDWIVGDDDGVVVIPERRVVEVANRAQDVLEREEREMTEIEEGSTLGKVSQLIRWEQHRGEESDDKEQT
jgi:3-hexulose-6-phosphate synthase/6-phospho-3-hexuloisomerase